ncbi:MAG: RdgB/HAM1 family non-canonical purine NTP pyrophosphatase [Acidobacteriota bacterium]
MNDVIQSESRISNPNSQTPSLLIATSNNGKVAEIASLLEGSDYRVIGFGDLPEAPPAVEETGATFAENALLKAEHYHALTGLLTLADDSGLEVDALEGRPGVYSARYGGEGLTSAQQIELLLNEMNDVPDECRTARFVCSIAVVGELSREKTAGGQMEKAIRQTFEGQCEGIIARQPRGSGGFGYDPIFIDPETRCTFAELTRDQKAARSHRGKALKQTRGFLMKWL